VFCVARISWVARGTHPCAPAYRLWRRSVVICRFAVTVVLRSCK
jgi:hypothetical protein